MSLVNLTGDKIRHVVSIEGVQVTAECVTVSGRSVLPDGTCVLTKLLADGSPQTWWPMDACAAVQGGAWQAVVSLGQAGAPERLDASVFYEVRAWRQDDPRTEVTFPFDLAGPPMPPLSNDGSVYHWVEIADTGVSIEVPDGWLRLDPEWTWTPEESGSLRLSVKMPSGWDNLAVKRKPLPG